MEHVEKLLGHRVEDSRQALLEINALLAKAPRVYGKKIHDTDYEDWAWKPRMTPKWVFDKPANITEDGHDTHTALLLAIEPIEKAVSEEYLKAFLEKEQSWDSAALSVLRKIYEHGYKGKSK